LIGRTLLDNSSKIIIIIKIVIDKNIKLIYFCAYKYEGYEKWLKRDNFSSNEI